MGPLGGDAWKGFTGSLLATCTHDLWRLAKDGVATWVQTIGSTALQIQKLKEGLKISLPEAHGTGDSLEMLLLVVMRNMSSKFELLPSPTVMTTFEIQAMSLGVGMGSISEVQALVCREIAKALTAPQNTYRFRTKNRHEIRTAHVYEKVHEMCVNNAYHFTR